MNSRQRVRACLAGEATDRAPNGLGGCETEGLHIALYKRLQRLLGVKDSPVRMDTFMLNAVFEEDVIEAMGGDIILLASPRMCGADLRNVEIGGGYNGWKSVRLWGEDYLVPNGEFFTEQPDGSTTWDNRGVKCPSGGWFFDGTGTTDLFADFDTPNPDFFNPSPDIDPNYLRRLEEAAKRLYNETELSICLGETITDLQVAPNGMIGSMILMREEPDIMREFLQKSLDSALSQLKQLDEAVGKYVDILSIAHDFGDNRGVTIGAPLWREIYKPYYKKLFEGWHSLTNMKINLHSCGSIESILPDLIECGLDIFNPVQTSACDMGAAHLKEKFGKDIIFWGGAYDAQLFTGDESYEYTYDKVEENVKILGKDGGFIFSGVHNLPPSVPDAHLRAIIGAGRG